MANVKAMKAMAEQMFRSDQKDGENPRKVNGCNEIGAVKKNADKHDADGR